MLIAPQISAQGFDWAPERRKGQFPTEAAHLFVPLPYSYPGIGEGFFLIGNLSNVFETTMDAVLIAVTGDATGTVFQGDDIPLVNNRLLLNVHLQDINRAVINSYQIRGMNSSQAYKLLDITRADQSKFEIQYTAFERRLNIIASSAESSFSLDAIRDKDGNIIQQLAEPYTSDARKTAFGVNVDFTDDYQDPRRGVRFELGYRDEPAENDREPDFYTLDYSALLYIPYRGNDTLVLNYYQSDAHVRRTGNTDPADIRAELDLQCGPADNDCLAAEQELVDNTINGRLNGSATSLGGLSRLRAYPQGRYEGGHMAFVGAEYRWNMTEENTAFNYLFWKDVRTGMQVALFAEIGSVAETTPALWDEHRSTAGVGFRLVTASGSVYRADLAGGEEGMETAIFFYYPW